jgi:hypothetical protein
MALVNTSGKTKLFINEINYSDYLIEGNISDDSAYSTNIITSKGSITLGGDTTILDFNKTKFPVGSRVTIYTTLDNGRLAKLPRGHLYVLSSQIDVNNRFTTLELGCSLAYLSSREEVFTDRVAGLINEFISSEIKGSFIIDDYNLSTLQTLLEIEGKVIFQDRWGNVQGVDQFGSDGLGSRVSAAKLTSFDKATAIAIESLGGSIEDIPSGILIETDVEVPSSEEEDTTDATPPPFVTSTTTRLIRYPDIEKTPGKFKVENDTTSGAAGLQTVAGCGTLSEPSEGEESKYAYTAKGEATVIEKEIEETVTQGRYVRYDGPGKQVDWEYDFEYCSALTYAGSFLRTAVDKYAGIVNEEVEKSNAFLSKANQSYALRDDYRSRPYSVTRTFEDGELISEVWNEGSQFNIDAAEFYGCASDQYYNAGVGVLDNADFFVKDAENFIDKYANIYGISNMNQTFNSYGPGGELVKKVTFKYIHTASTQRAQDAAQALSAFYTTGGDPFGIRYQRPTQLYTNLYTQSFGTELSRTLAGDDLLTEHRDDYFSNPTRYFNLKLATKTTVTYSYGSVYTTETETFEDFENPSNNYVRSNYSSSGSRNAPEQDRITVEKDGNGCIYLNDSAASTENKELSKFQFVTITNSISGPTIPVSWLGYPSKTVKTVQMPLTFAPIRAKSCNGVKSSPDVSGTLNKYEAIMSRYAANLAKKIVGDSLGYRITESGNRAEVFSYYPFYPVALNLTSLQKGYKLRAASSNWVFDSNNVICSFDCYNVGYVENIAAAEEVSPFVYLAFDKTEVTVTLNNNFFLLPETADSIVIKVLPSGGTLNLSGSPVSVNDVIDFSDIDGGNVTFVPTSPGATTEIAIFYEVLDSSGDNIRSDVGIYPPIQVVYPDLPFADGGDFTANTTNGGYDGDGGEFDTGTRPGGPMQLNAGDFDTGATVVHLEPESPTGASTANGDTDPETDLGINVLDANDTSISSDRLAVPRGNTNSNFEVIVDFGFTPRSYLKLDFSLLPQRGWNYGAIANSTGTSIDLGTIIDPNDYVMDFGTIATPNQPVLASSVV